MLIRNILAAIIVLCLGVIGCGERNNPIGSETFFDGPIVITGDLGAGANNCYLPLAASPIICESDLIFVGEVVENIGGSWLSARLKIVEVLKGATNEKYVSFICNGPYTGLQPSFVKGEKHIIFVRQDGDGFVFTTGLGVHCAIAIELPYLEDSYHHKNDIQLLLSAYDKNRELFSKAGKQDLISLYPQLKSEYIKSRVLYDLADLVDENDTEFFAIGLQSDDKQYNLFSIMKIGDLRIEQFKETIANLLSTIPDIPANNQKLFYLLIALREYADIKFKDIFFEYINGKNQTFRRISYHAIGIINDEKTLLALVPYYGKESDFGERSSILTALEKINNNDVLIPVLLELKKIETVNFLIHRIDDIIAERTGE